MMRKLPKARHATTAEVRNFIDRKIGNKKNGFIPAYLLPTMFTIRSGLRVSAKRFFRIARRSGLRLNVSPDGMYLEGIEFIEE
jgi:hypothetical protein